MLREYPVVGASALVRKNGGEVLLVKRLNEPGKMKWALPGGKVDYGETVEQTAVREVKEETSIDIELNELLGPYNIIGENYHYVTICYSGNPKNTEIVSGSDVERAEWVTPENLNELTLTSTTEKALKDADIL